MSTLPSWRLTFPSRFEPKEKSMNREETSAHSCVLCHHTEKHPSVRSWLTILLVAISGVVLAALVPAPALAQITYMPEQIFAFENMGNGTGYAVAAGDVNGDGRDELVLGAVFDGSFNGTSDFVCNEGAVVIVSGGTSDPPSFQLVAEILNPDKEHDAAFGYSVACGDVNGDGLADVLV